MAIPQRVIGDIGEFLAAKYLEEQGYFLVRYGKEMLKSDPLAHLKLNYEVCPDNGCGIDWEHDFKKWSEDDLRCLTREGAPYGKDFLFINFAVNEYIQRCWWYYNENNSLPHDGIKIRDLQKLGKIDEAERLKDENRAALNKFPGQGSHPGRYDFICFKAGQYLAVEVKVNNSRLSYWQSIRLGLIKKFGGNAYIIKIKLSKEDLSLCSKNKICNCSSLEMLPVDLDKIDSLPSDEEFLKIVRFSARHEAFQQQLTRP
ncbi:hypothetical protein GNX18_07805 [Microbulbifer sp. SH-1]|uniref:hypothetical protein n=1 Tax=Microbulbifer sp. SH-1 TaxID=2681547 RepID=UPI00140BE5F1|nr:hypothetical protein [Microbulbifer sp. SH-1]QIL89668.1 hypothetical protein GNX18_07805 [Microbulbifer sp. SH-1]